METAPASRPLPRRGWLTFSLRTLAVFVAISALIITRYAAQIRELWNDRQSQYQEIETVEGLNKAMASRRAVIFCDARWSIDAAQGRLVFQTFIQRWRERVPEVPVRFYLLDMTEPDRDVVKAAVELGFSKTQGSGELLWIRDGKPRDYTMHLEYFSVDQLSAVAQRAFDLPGVKLGPQAKPNSGSESR
jgi:hypothetical protein